MNTINNLISEHDEIKKAKDDLRALDDLSLIKAFNLMTGVFIEILEERNIIEYSDKEGK